MIKWDLPHQGTSSCGMCGVGRFNMSSYLVFFLKNILNPELSRRRKYLWPCIVLEKDKETRTEEETRDIGVILLFYKSKISEICKSWIRTSGLERWLSGYQHWVHLQKAQVWFRAPTWCLPTLKPSSGDLFSSDLHQHQHHTPLRCTFIHTGKYASTDHKNQ